MVEHTVFKMMLDWIGKMPNKKREKYIERLLGAFDRIGAVACKGGN